MKTILRYGANWPINYPELEQDVRIEMACIQCGGIWDDNGVTCGQGLHYHYSALQRLLWPDDDEHRWSKLILKAVVENDVAVFMGPGDGSKTYSISKFPLMQFWTFPEKTLWLVSSTEQRGAELRNWGTIKQLFNRAKELHPWLPGNVLESIHGITTERISKDQALARLLTKGIICIPVKEGLAPYVGIKPVERDGFLGHFGDECFPAGTLVDTPNGPTSIESLKQGDLVVNVLGLRKIKRLIKRRSRSLVSVNLADGRKIVCTPEHPILTQKGWKKACDVHQGHYIVSVYEAMQILRYRDSLKGSLQMVPNMQMGAFNCEVQAMRKGFQKALSIRECEFLLSTLCYDIQATRPEFQGKIVQRRSEQEAKGVEEANVFEQSRTIHTGQEDYFRGHGKIHELFNTRSNDKATNTSKHDCQKAWNKAEDQRRKWNWTHNSGKNFTGIISRIQKQLPCENRSKRWQRFSEKLQSGCCISRNKISRGSRWVIPRSVWPEGIGREKNEMLNGSWVDSVTVYKPDDSGKHEHSDRGIEVYNLEIEGHPSYSVNGLVVHNCQHFSPSFLDAYSNWYGKLNFKGILAGNGKDIDDCLGMAAEPLEGWLSWKDTEKTQEWRSKFYHAWVVALDGRDSPNFDFPRTRTSHYPYLIGYKKLEGVEKFHGKDSWQWWNQCVGKVRPGAAARRVISRQLCEEHHAFDDVVWQGTEITKVGYCDAAYGGVGGDRCVAGYIEFGKETSGNTVIACHPPVIVPVKVSNEGLPEDQIANFCRDYFKSVGVEAKNFFFDARATMAITFARLWSPDVNAIDFGGVSTQRPVSMDEYVWEGDTGGRRLKLCSEHYCKFVTELWFTLYYVIVSNQMRQLPKEIAEEGYRREWSYTKGNRIEVETKQQMKERTKYSPDLCDGLVAGLEGARRLGFQISSMSNPASSASNDRWFERVLTKRRNFSRQNTLIYTS